MYHSSRRTGRRFGTFWLIVVCLLFGIIGTPPLRSQAYAGVFSWATVAPIPQQRTEAQGGAVNGKLYVLGGFNDSQYRATTRSDVYNPATNSWSRIASMPQAITHAASVADGNTIWMLGGYVGNHPGPSTNRVLKYNTQTNSWSNGPALPAARGGGTAAIVGRNLHFISGALRTGNTTNDTDKPEHYVLNLDGGTSWTRAADLPLARNHIGSAVLNGRIYVIGGQFGHNEGTTNQARVDVYNPATNSWSRAADLPVARGHIEASVLTIHGQIYVFGGSTNDGDAGKSSADAFVYDPQRNVWMRMPSLPAGRKSPIAGYINGQIFVGPGGTGAPSTTVWAATLPDRWETLASAPIALGEVAGGIINDKLYLVGESNNATLRYTFGSNSWSSNLAQRPFPGHHHAAEVFNNRLYIFGGLGSGAGKVQIYNPSTNSWSTGADMPFAAGSSSSALINGRIYVAGGIVGNSTTTQAAVYNPTTNSWQAIAPMPQGRNHAAAATDGTRFFVFGGRGPGSGDGNTVANGFDTVQIYNPATNSWQSSANPGSTLQPLPIGRGGMGKAVYAGGRFYVIGGETASGPGATTNKVYNRVDVYDPAANSWSQLATMPTARHGIFPLLIGNRIYVAAGGVKAAYSSSNVLEVFNLPGAANTPPTNTPPTNPPAPATAAPTTAAPTTPPTGGAIRINTGGAAQTVNSVSWSACTSPNACNGYVSGGFAYSEPNDTTADIPAGMNNAIFTSEWTGGQSGGTPVGGTAFSFNVPVNNGAYLVRLHFAELNKAAAGERVFDVLVENGQGNLPNFDVFVAAGGMNKAIMREFPVTVSDGAATISFIHRVENAKVSAIEILPMAQPAPTTASTATVASTATPLPSATATSTPPPSATTVGTTTPGASVIVRLNAGGPAVTADGVDWSADAFFNSGKSYSNAQVSAIAATTADALYLTERSATTNLGSFSYAIPVPAAGEYRVRLHFAEIYWGATGGGTGGAGKRVFSVNLEGSPVELVNYDINAAVGPMTADVREFTLPVNDGVLNIDFTASVDQPKVSAIEVLTLNASIAAPTNAPQPSPTPTTTETLPPEPTSTPTTAPSAQVGGAIRINTGGAAQMVNGVSWSACTSPSACDGYVSGGFAYSEPNDTTADIPAGMNDAIFTSEWTGGQSDGIPVGGTAFSFNVPVSNGAYLVRLHFAELNKAAAGARVFDVLVEDGQGNLPNFDVFVAAGGMNKAIVREFPVTVSDGAATISFIHRVENAKVSAIEILPLTAPTATPMNTATALPTDIPAATPEPAAATDQGALNAWPWDSQRMPLRAGGVRDISLAPRNPYVCLPE